MQASLAAGKKPSAIVDVGERTALRRLMGNDEFVAGVDSKLGKAGAFSEMIVRLERAIEVDCKVLKYDPYTMKGLNEALTGFIGIKFVKKDGQNYVRETLLRAFGGKLDELHVVSKVILDRMRAIKPVKTPSGNA